MRLYVCVIVYVLQCLLLWSPSETALNESSQLQGQQVNSKEPLSVDKNKANHDLDQDHNHPEEGTETQSNQIQDRKRYVRLIFDKYGEGGFMTFDGFEHLLGSLGLEKQIKGHDFSDHQIGTENFIHKDHDSHELEKVNGSTYPGKELTAESSDDSNVTYVESGAVIDLAENTSSPAETGPPTTQPQQLVIEKRCLTASEILKGHQLSPFKKISLERFELICPAIVYELDQRLCSQNYAGHLSDHHHHHDHDHELSGDITTNETKESLFHLWLYASGAVLLISVFGLMSILTIPLVQQHHHGDVLQLLVGLAIGTLTSDALLHLLPHAFSGQTHQEASEGHAQGNHTDDHSHATTVYYGLMALMGIIGFLTFERVLTIVSDLCNKSNRKTTKIANCNRAGEKPSNHNHSHKNHNHSHHGEEAACPSELEKLNEPEKLGMAATDEKKMSEAIEVACLNGANGTNGPSEKHAHQPLTTEQCHRETVVYQHPDPDRGFVVQLTDHHHHHQHQHQKGGKSGSIIAMIVTGDGLHNFMDGLAIGIAFAGGGLGGGISTSVAVLCHELPHEVGDFAVLLKAGLSVKRAVMYNTLSAVLCFIGMTVGVVVGKMDTGMLSAVIAGMFLYIALVDMIPQLDCCPTGSGTTRAFKLSVQLIGMGIGVGIMSVISIYEPSLQALLS